MPAASPATPLRVESVRGSIVESVHRVSAAVVDSAGTLVACAGDPHLRTFMRSAAKPFQAVPLIEDGAADAWAITPQEMALACASHNSEPEQVELVRRLLLRIGCAEPDLACGPHRPLADDLAVPDDEGVDPRVDRRVPPTPLASNCSGKHTGMLALARHCGWPVAGYHLAGHPVQERCKQAVAEWTGVAIANIGEGVDGCGVVSFAVAVAEMARAYARLACLDGAGRVLVDAMRAHPDLVAGKGRLCTALISALPVVAKVGAEGVYGASLLDRGLGVALKVEDGHTKAAGVALLAILEQLGVTPSAREALGRHATLPIRNTRHETVAVLRAAGELSFV